MVVYETVQGFKAAFNGSDVTHLDYDLGSGSLCVHLLRRDRPVTFWFGKGTDFDVLVAKIEADKDREYSRLRLNLLDLIPARP